MLPACSDTSELAAGLKYLFSADGVHFTDQGYEKIAHVIAKSAAMQLSKNSVLLPSLFQVQQLAPVARNPVATTGEAFCRLSAVQDRKIQTMPISPHTQAPAESGKVIRWMSAGERPEATRASSHTTGGINMKISFFPHQKPGFFNWN
jgi:hypothetical protein